jgi:hypothetical protein
MNYTTISEALRANKYPVFTGQMNPTLVGIRTNDTYTNAFTDFMCVLWTDTQGNNQILTVRATTKPGLYGDGAIKNPRTINGIFGTACMVPGHYPRLWKMINMDRVEDLKKLKYGMNPWAYPYLHQIGHCKIYRDGDLNDKITKTVIQDSYNDGINAHFMGNDLTPTITTDDNLNNWSLGCQGSPAQDWIKVCRVLAECRRYTGDVISYTLLHIDSIRNFSR